MNSYDALRNRIELMIQIRLSKFQAQWAENLEALQESQSALLESYKVVNTTLENHMAVARRRRQEEFERLRQAELNIFFDWSLDVAAVEELGNGWVQMGRVFYAGLREVLDADYQKIHQLSDAFYSSLRSQCAQFNKQFATACSAFCTEVVEQIVHMVKA